MQKWIVAVVVGILLAGCNDQKSINYAPENEQLADRLIQDVKSQKSVQEVEIVILQNYIVVAFDVSPWQRYKRKKIEESIENTIKDQHRQYEVIVSSDIKLKFELAKLEKKSDKEKVKAIKKIQGLLKEET